MSKLLTMLMAAGLGLGLNGAIAQNVTSEGDRAQGQERLMQNKEQGSTQSQDGARERRKQDYERTQSNQGTDSQSSGNQTSGDQTGVNPSEDNSTAQRDRNSAPSGGVPQQSMPSVGHPQEGAQTGQFGKKDMDQSGQSQSSPRPESR